MRNKKGFTLIELLVVVAIIGILAAIGVTAVGDARVRARDAKKMADVSQLRTALETYYGDTARYPTIAGATLEIQGLCLTSGAAANFDICPGFGTLYMAVPPAPGTANCTDGSVGYRYISVDANTLYQVEFCLEKATGGYAAGKKIAVPAGIR